MTEVMYCIGKNWCHYLYISILPAPTAA